ncbi:hypothetical protein DFQ14_11750 [Halopolyspora algeriensis]|uniref:Lipase (Class 3) n=1 Tax=Halopolyspora algeriensis TaxID=1500506 RepID=A0A368VHT5_9ACTN|nr:hypothetical protein [Halopolyspora algeriensis]RCW39214.1 hypothetical protein DFQ14_11750 [Halopolyspora algeriensis]TQM47419.1 hypothetical protein FHU43_3407 [Halopolyspora algeriensis]
MQVPGPDTRVVELRVHGILGTTPEDLTDSVASVDVAGDGVGRIVRPADRLLRPVPGPMLTAGERSVPRTVEGYVWGEMTSGGTKATWALLFPFALANMAHWMLPQARSDSALGRTLAPVLRALMRLAALLLTMLFTAQLTVLVADLLAAQCLRAGSGCLGHAVPDVIRQAETARSVFALLTVSLVVLAMQWLSTMSWHVRAPRTEGPHHSARAPLLPGANVVTDPDTPALRMLHTVAALSTMVVLALGGPFAAPSDPRRLAASLLLALCLLGAVALDDPTGAGSRGGRALRAALGRLPRRLLMATAAALVLVTALVPPPMNGPLPGSGPVIDALVAGLLLTCTALGLLLIPAARSARPAWAHLPRHLRPWAGGWMAAPILLTACLIGAGFGAGLALSLRQALGTPGLELPHAYDSVALFWGVATALTVLAALVTAPYLWFTWWRETRAESGVSPEIALLHAGRPQDQQRAAGAWQWAEWQRRYGHHLLLFAAAVLATGTGVSLVLRWAAAPYPGWSRWLLGLGVGALAALALTALRTVYLAVKRPQVARRLGVLCDLTLFWPREAHPVVPPCYAVKIIPELVQRVTEHLADPDTRVVLVGHSQGSLLAAVAAARLMDSLPEADRERVGLVTAGSQLQWAYARAFPGSISHGAQRELAGALDGRWHCLCRGTDPLGGAVSTWNRQVHDGKLLGVGFRPDGTQGPLPAATRGPTGALVLGGDHWMPDPQRGPFGIRRWVPGVLQHAEYSGDPEWDRAIAMAAELEIPVRGANLPLCTPATTATPPLGEVDPAAPYAHGTDAEPAEATADRATVASGPTEETARIGEATDHPAPAGAPDPPEQSCPRTTEVLEEPPEITEPRGKTPPWERTTALRPTEH